MSNYRVVELSPSQYVIEVKKTIKKWYWFGGKREEWHLANVDGSPYGEKYAAYHAPFWFKLGKEQIIPCLMIFPYPRQAKLKIQEFERETIFQSLPKVVS